MRIHHRIATLVCLILLIHGVARSYPRFKSNDRVAFIGDSITHGGMYLPYIQTFYATGFPIGTPAFESGYCG